MNGFFGQVSGFAISYKYSPSAFYAAMIDLHIRMSDGSFKLMQINIANVSSGAYTYTEQSTSEVGNTAPISINVVYDSDYQAIRILGTNTSVNYDAVLKAYIRHINA